MDIAHTVTEELGGPRDGQQQWAPSAHRPLGIVRGAQELGHLWERNCGGQLAGAPRAHMDAATWEGPVALPRSALSPRPSSTRREAAVQGDDLMLPALR